MLGSILFIIYICMSTDFLDNAHFCIFEDNFFKQCECFMNYLYDKKNVLKTSYNI